MKTQKQSVCKGSKRVSVTEAGSPVKAGPPHDANCPGCRSAQKAQGELPENARCGSPRAPCAEVSSGLKKEGTLGPFLKV